MLLDSGNQRAPEPQQTTGGTPPPEQEHIPCPRCDSNQHQVLLLQQLQLSQPRHFCKSCRPYWTHDGTLQDIPVSGGTRKHAKHSRTLSTSSSSPSTTNTNSISSHEFLSSTPVLMSFAVGHRTLVSYGGDLKPNMHVGGGRLRILEGMSSVYIERIGYDNLIEVIRV